MPLSSITWILPKLSRYARFMKFLTIQGYDTYTIQPPALEQMQRLRKIERKRKVLVAIQVVAYIALFSSLIAAILYDIALTTLAAFLQGISGIISTGLLLLLLLLIHYLLWLNDADQQFHMTLIITQCQDMRTAHEHTGNTNPRQSSRDVSSAAKEAVNSSAKNQQRKEEN